jgi:hypothetical protein
MENKSTCIKYKDRHFFYSEITNESVDKAEKRKEDKVFDDKKDETELLDSKSLHDLYRHTTKLIK